MKQFSIIAGTIITYGLINSCAADLKERIKGHWISHETILKSGTKKKIDSLRIIGFNSDATYFSIEKGEDILGTWTLTKEKTENSKRGLITVIVNRHSIVYEILDIKDDELVLLESDNGHRTSIQILFKRVKM